MSNFTVTEELDATGLSCPMPIVKARQAVSKLGAGQVLKVIASDRGSVQDFQGWAKTSKDVRLVGQETLDQGGKTVYVHYVQKA